MHQLTIHSGHVRAVDYSPDGRRLVSAGNDRTVRLIEAATGKILRSWDGLRRILSCACFSPSGDLIVAGGGAAYDTATGGVAIALLDPEGSVVKTMELEIPFGGGYERADDGVTGLGYSADGKFFFAAIGNNRNARAEGDVHLWRCSTEREWTPDRTVTVSGSVWSGAFSPDGTTLAVGTGLGRRVCSVTPWNLGAADTQGRGTKSLAWSPDGRTLAVASGHSVLLVHAETNAVRATLAGHEAPIVALAFTPDGQRLLSGGWDRNVRVWDPNLATPVAAYDWERGKVQHIAVAPDGMTAAAACDKGIVLWDLDD